MRTCDKCGKANQPTRKFCIRCGGSLLKKTKPSPAVIVPAPTVETPVAPQPTSPTITEEEAVKPSQVSRDRVRVAGGTKQLSELDKAKAAFAKAETVGIDEPDGSGIIETRMLRASEVRELLEGPGMMDTGEEVPAPTMMEGSEPLPPEAAEMMTPNIPTSSQIEESILGSKSAFVEQAPKPEAPPLQPETQVSSAVTTGFNSSKYEQDETVPPGTEEEAVTGFASQTPPVTEAPAEPLPAAIAEDLDLVIACPDCGKVINVDMFEYPREVYSAMAAARLKQTRFFIVQGKGNEALRIVRLAYALYTKAGDNFGLDEVKKIIETLAKKP
ncbi:MAG: hypothetical protein ACTSW7_02550 [Candidatus Thorarchaeota archaeon]